jgi:AraC-like DNA-binding protein
VLAALIWMRDATPPQSERDVRLLRTLLYALLHEIDNLRAGTEVFRDPVYHAAKILRHASHYRFSLASLADHVDMSPFHLNRRFRQIFGCPPMRYLQGLRLEHALHLLQNTRMPIKDIAARVGYRHESHLAYLLRREYGQSPGRLRRAGAQSLRSDWPMKAAPFRHLAQTRLPVATS